MEKRWTAQWIQNARFAGLKPSSMLHKELQPVINEHPTELRNQHTLFRKSFTLDLLPHQAVLDLTADDYYKLYINGHFVAQGPAQGYPFHYFYNRLDILPYLHQGENIIAVHVYYLGTVSRALNSGDLRQGMIAELQMDGQDWIGTDETWKMAETTEYGHGEIIGYETQFLEPVDSRLTYQEWTQPNYDDTAWESAVIARNADYQLVLQPTPLLSVYEKQPSSVQELASGHYLIDFGTELTGQFILKASGQSGQQVTIRCGEELNADGLSVRYELRCNCVYEETWTLSGKVEESPAFFDYKAFRYVEVLGPREALLPESFGAIVRHYPLDESKCRFESSDPILNQIWDICKNGVKYGSQENFVDCPSREKGQYLGDNTVIGHSHLYLSGDLRLFKKAIEDFARSAAACPGLLAVAPGNFMQEIADFSLQWPMQLWVYYQHSGDLAFLRRMAPTAEAILAYFKKYEDASGLLCHVKEKWNLVDWPENLRDGYDFPLTRPVGEGCHNVINAWYYGCRQTVNEIRQELGQSKEDLSELKAAFLAGFYRPQTGLFADAVTSTHSSLHANVLPLLFELAPKEAIPSIVSLIRDKRLHCGVYFAYFVLKALAKVGEYGIIYELIRCEDERSWVNMLREGATTCFEAWGKEQKWNTSLCHPWASAPIPLLIEEIIGLKPGKPGWTEVRFTPHIPECLDGLHIQIPVPTGTIKVTFTSGQTSIQTPEGVSVISG